MISEIIMPALGATGGDAVMEAWLVQPGQKVKAGQPLFVVTTDKATVEVEAFRDGVLREIRLTAGDTVPLGAVVGLLADTLDEPLGEALPKPDPEARSSDSKSQPSPHPRDGSGSTERRWASPVARRLAAEAGIPLDSLPGSGRLGQVLRRDVEQAIASQRRGSYPPLERGERLEALSPMRRTIAARTILSKGAVPHFYAGITIDVAAALTFRETIMQRAEAHGWAKPTLTDLCLRATGLALRAFPELNASFQEDHIAYYEEVNIGLVVGLDEGMIVPVIRGADRMNLYALAAETVRLTTNARHGRLRAEEVSGATFTLSNLGMYGVDWFAAIINPPEAGILAVGAVKERPAVLDGEFSSRPEMDVTLAVDHRLVDGVTAARFLAFFKDCLENPLDLVLEGPPEPNL